MNQFPSTRDEIKLHCGSPMARNLAQTHNIRTSCPDKEILLINEDALGEFLHAKQHPLVAVAHALSVIKIIFVLIGSVFGASFSPHEWEVFAQSHCKAVEHFQSSPDLCIIAQNHSAIVDFS